MGPSETWGRQEGLPHLLFCVSWIRHTRCSPPGKARETLSHRYGPNTFVEAQHAGPGKHAEAWTTYKILIAVDEK